MSQKRERREGKNKVREGQKEKGDERGKKKKREDMMTSYYKIIKLK